MRTAPRPSSMDLFISIIVSFNLALAQPILELIGDNPEFFLARDAPRSDIVLVALAWTIAIPVLVWLAAYIATKLHADVGHGMHGLLFTVILAALTIQILERLPLVGSTPGVLLIVVATLIGATTALAFYAFESVRSFLRIGAVAPVVVLGIFFFVAPVSKLIFPEPATTIETEGSSDVPVVMIVLDELPVSSLMNLKGRIDRHLFPHFARFAGDATWFRNTTTVAAVTERAIPALLDGRYPRERSIPILSEHPNNLFTIMAGSHEVVAHEPITSLCPTEVCEPEPSVAPASRFNDLVSDLSIILSHVALPADLTQSLPPIDQQWGNFREQSSALPEEFSPTTLKPGRFDRLREGDPRLDYHRFLRKIEPSEGEHLYFFHSVLPHSPWRFLPSGQQYPQTAPGPGIVDSDEGRLWDDDEWLVAQGWQRHLLQLAYVDDFLGRVMRRLRSADLYDRALIVVVSDHGTSFEVNQPLRGLTPDTIGSLAPVPLLVKEPGQRRGHIDDRPAQTIDVLPTILDIAGVNTSSSLAGRSLFDAGAPKLPEKRFGWEEITFSAEGEEKFDVVRRKYEAFSANDGRLDPFRIAPEGTIDLVGQRLSRVSIGPEIVASVSVDQAQVYERADPQSDPFPALLNGTIRSDRLISGEAVLAVAVNGRIAALTRTYDRSGDEASFYAMLSPTFFSGSGNELRMFVVDGELSERRLNPVAVP